MQRQHGYYLPPSTGRTQLVNQQLNQQFVNTEPANSSRTVRKFFSSLGPNNETGGNGYLYTANIAGAIRNLIAVRFLSIQVDFQPDNTTPSKNTGFVLLEGGLVARESYMETASGAKYSAKFSFPSFTAVGTSEQFEYTFPMEYYQPVLHSTSIDQVTVKILEEDTTGELVPMTSITYSNLELELTLGLNKKQSY